MTETGELTYQPAEQAAALQRMLAAGAVESSVTFSVVTLVFGGVQASLAVTSWVKLPLEPAAKVKVLETYGPPAGSRPSRRRASSPACATAGYAAEAGPEPPSATALESVNEPPAAPL